MKAWMPAICLWCPALRLWLVVLVDTHTDTVRMQEEEDRVHTVDADYSHQLPPVVVEEGHCRLVHPNIEKEEEGMGSY